MICPQDPKFYHVQFPTLCIEIIMGCFPTRHSSCRRPRPRRLALRVTERSEAHDKWPVSQPVSISAAGKVPFVPLPVPVPFQSTFPFLPPLFTSFAFDRDGRTAALLPRKVEQPVSEFGPFLQLCISASRAADAFGSISVCLHPPGFLKFIAGSNKEGSGHFVSPFSNGNIFPSGITATGNVTGRGDK